MRISSNLEVAAEIRGPAALLRVLLPGFFVTVFLGSTEFVAMITFLGLSPVVGFFPVGIVLMAFVPRPFLAVWVGANLEIGDGERKTRRGDAGGLRILNGEEAGEPMKESPGEGWLSE